MVFGWFFHNLYKKIESVSMCLNSVDTNFDDLSYWPIIVHFKMNKYEMRMQHVKNAFFFYLFNFSKFMAIISGNVPFVMS